MGGRGPCRAVIRLLPLGCALLLAPSPTSGFVLFSPWGKIEQGDEYRTDPYISKDGALTWQGPQSFELYETVFLWSWPESELDHSGLGGGITWALHPDFCAQMLPHFPEASRTGTFATFLTCDDLHHAIASGLNTWAMNHRNIAFHDVTSGCEETLRGGSRSCAAAEVLVQTYSGAARNEAAKTVIDHTTIDFRPRLTSGEQLSFGLGVRGALLNVSTDACWYLDETFCYTFHRLKTEHGVDIEAVVFLACLGSGLLAGGVLLILLFAGCLAVCGFDRFTPSSPLQDLEAAARAARRIKRSMSFRSPNHQRATRRRSDVASRLPKRGPAATGSPVQAARASKAHLSTDGRGEVGEIEEEEEEEGWGAPACHSCVLRGGLIRLGFGLAGRHRTPDCHLCRWAGRRPGRPDWILGALHQWRRRAWTGKGRAARQDPARAAADYARLCAAPQTDGRLAASSRPVAPRLAPTRVAASLAAALAAATTTGWGGGGGGGAPPKRQEWQLVCRPVAGADGASSRSRSGRWSRRRWSPLSPRVP